MRIIEGKENGFCFGVQRSINKTKNLLKDKELIYALGDLVHNEEVINELKQEGLIVVQDLGDVPKNNKVIFRAHGETLENYQKAQERNLEVIDLTCGKVKRIHRIIQDNNTDNYILIIGKKTHPEVIGHTSYAKNYSVIENISDISLSKESFNKSNLKNIYYVVQTTFNSEKFQEILKEVKKVYQDISINGVNTICETTINRQREVLDIAKKATKVIIVGDKNSSNTKELFNLAKKNNQEVFLILHKKELKEISLKDSDIVGIIGGASTSIEMINEIKSNLE